jgi:hypothetical protein
LNRIIDAASGNDATIKDESSNQSAFITGNGSDAIVEEDIENEDELEVLKDFIWDVDQQILKTDDYFIDMIEKTKHATEGFEKELYEKFTVLRPWERMSESYKNNLRSRGKTRYL